MNRNLVINGLIVAAAVMAGLLLSQRPWEVFKDQQSAADASVAEMRASEKSREELVRQEASLRSSIGKEELARQRGWLPANEIPAPK